MVEKGAFYREKTACWAGRYKVTRAGREKDMGGSWKRKLGALRERSKNGARPIFWRRK